MDQAPREHPTESVASGYDHGLLDLEEADHVPLRRLRKLVHLLRRPTYRSALLLGVAAGVEHESVFFGYEFATVIDVGANCGQFALFAAGRFPRAALICLEPLAAPRAKLKSVLARHDGVTILDIAASATDERRAFHVSRSAASSSLLAPTDALTTVFPGTDSAAMIEIRTARLDAILPDAPMRPCLLKIDVQGAELEVLRGAERLLEEIDEVYVECSLVELYGGQPLLDDIVVHLVKHDFRLRGIHSLTRDKRGRCLQADVLFSRRVP